jgi:hypothetical protein
MPATKTQAPAKGTKSSVTTAFEWLERPYLGDAVPIGTALINGKEYAVFSWGTDDYRNAVWCCSEHDTDNYYDITLKTRGGVRSPLACTCPQNKHRGVTCKHMVAVAGLLDEAFEAYECF